MRRSRRWLLAAALASLAVAACAGTALWVALELRRPHAGWAGGHVDVDLPPGLSARSMLERLGQAGVLRRPRIVGHWIALRGGGESLQAGEYRFERPASPREVLARLERGDVLLHAVTVPEGLMLDQVAARFAAAGFGPQGALLAAFGDPAAIRELDPAAEDLEGYLFPETYHFPRGTAPSRIAATMVQRFSETIGGDYVERAAGVGLRLREAVTLASMIEMETSVPDERRRISRVFHNRLARGMRLQCDPTVRYALHRAGRTVERLTYADLEFDSPWNTYVAASLPPGPIASPGWASLEAAVDPEPGDDLYFVAAPGGGHRFSPTLRAHLEAVAEWRAYSRSSR